jgi:hypothetical protein
MAAGEADDFGNVGLGWTAIHRLLGVPVRPRETPNVVGDPSHERVPTLSAARVPYRNEPITIARWCKVRPDPFSQPPTPSASPAFGAAWVVIESARAVMLF